MKKPLEQRIKELQKQRREFYKTTTKCDCDDCELIELLEKALQAEKRKVAVLENVIKERATEELEMNMFKLVYHDGKGVLK